MLRRADSAQNGYGRRWHKFIKKVYELKTVKLRLKR